MIAALYEKPPIDVGGFSYARIDRQPAPPYWNVFDPIIGQSKGYPSVFPNVRQISYVIYSN